MINNIVIGINRKRNGKCKVQIYNILDFDVKDSIIVPATENIEHILLELAIKYELKNYDFKESNFSYFLKDVIKSITKGYISAVIMYPLVTSNGIISEKLLKLTSEGEKHLYIIKQTDRIKIKNNICLIS